MVTPYVPAVVDDRVQDAATVALAVILTGAGHVTVNPVAGLVTGVRATVPAKLNVLVRDGYRGTSSSRVEVDRRTHTDGEVSNMNSRNSSVRCCPRRASPGDSYTIGSRCSG